ncbi:MAG: haloalkane dehalogenase [Calditrichaeota bacterium]|nr:haloalkane dehalogenase [Calditrichota bacterium]
MHYVDKGEGDPILFIHGNPTSSYLWRNVIPHLETQGRVIAIDLIGMGKSDKPDIDYTFADHIQYVEGFIDTLKLKNITLVLHDWGSALGLDYASRHENNVNGIAFMEAIVPPGMPVASYEVMGPPGEFFRTMRDPVKGAELIIKQNMFIEEVLPSSVMRKLNEVEMDAYRAPFIDAKSRKPILVWPNEIPIGGVPANTVRVVSAYGKWMVNTDLPMLHLYASPGALNPPQVAEWLVQNVNNIESSYIGPGIHYVQEDHPHVIGKAIADWRRRLMK